MKTIERKSMLYKTGVEYGDYTLNHVQGCAHGCKYPCYAMQMSKRFGKTQSYKDWCQPKLAGNTLEILDKEIPRLKEKIQSVHLCFTTDPFMVGYDEVSNMSIRIIEKLNANGIKCTVLTKGILPEKLAQLSPQNEYGITLVSVKKEFQIQYEPYAASLKERVLALEKLHRAGCYTWVSMEPYPTPNIIEQDIEEVLNEISFADKIIFGRMHYNKIVSDYKEHKAFYNECAKSVVDFCKRNSISYHIKKGTVTELELLEGIDGQQ